MPKLLYRGRAGSFLLFCIVGVATIAVIEEVVLDPLLMAADNPKIQVTMNGLRWAALEALFASFSIAAMVAMYDHLESRRSLSALAELKNEAELAALKSQLNPHLILNTLNNLYSLALEQHERTPEMVLMLANILRYSLYESEEASAPLEREIEILQAYVVLQEIGIGERAAISFDITGSPQGRRIAPLLIVPIVENAFKHGGAVVQETPANIHFQLRIEADSITFVAENPVEPQQAADDTNGGIGLNNLRGRLALLYPNRHSLQVIPGDGLFRVVLTVTGEPA